MKKVSIVIPCFNAAKYLDRCMEHIVGQTIGLENIEIILVDDASTDDGATWDLIMQYENRYPDSIIAVSLEQNLRQGGARNVGISYAGGEYLMFCDVDDWLRLEAMEILYQVAKEENADVVEYRMQKIHSISEVPNKNRRGEGSYVRIMDTVESKKELLMGSEEDFSLGCIPKFYRMSLVQDNHIQFAEHLICEEPSFTLPVRLYEQKHVFLDCVLYYYFQSQGSTIRSNWDARKWDNAKVWMSLMQDLDKRGFLELYPDELEYMFYDWGLGLSVLMLVQRGYTLSKDELLFLRDMIFKRFPNVLENPYFIKNDDGWNALQHAILEMELTEQSVQELNRIMREYVLMYDKLSGDC